MPMSILIIVLVMQIWQTDANSFMALGDWGGYILGGYHRDNVLAIANTTFNMKKIIDARIMLNTGDNFYNCGIQNTSDFQIKKDYIDIFARMNIPWYNTLGNHDYGYNVSAQVDLSNKLSNWIMPGRYYYNRVILADDIAVHLIVLDTNPCVSGYRSNDSSKWVPCGKKHPTCSITHGNDTFEGECRFHQNILTQDCTQQYKWFLDTLYNITLNWDISKEWVIVMGHHPIDEVDVEDFTKVVNSNLVDLYINGHKHELQHYSIDGNAKYITTGAGSMVKPAGTSDDDGVEDAVDDIFDMGAGMGADVNDSILDKQKNMLWKKKITGFTTHTITGNTLLTRYVDTNTNVIYEFAINKS